jgi:protein phosphatase
MKRFHAAGRTEIGPVRENNEDSIVTGDSLLAVADGMGGHPGGAEASTLATELIAATFKSRSLDSLEAVVRAANWVVWQRASSTTRLEGMGTTICVAGLTDDGTLALANVGDSRAYLVHQGSFRRLTEDHTITAELVRQGKVSQEEAMGHPDRNILTRALGVGPEVEIDVDRVEIETDDLLLLCSDGLFTELSESEIRGAMLSKATPRAIVDTLVEQALTNGGNDNVSAVVACVES